MVFVWCFMLGLIIVPIGLIVKDEMAAKNNGGSDNSPKQEKPRGDAFKQVQDWTITLVLVVIAIICVCVACGRG